MGIENGGYIIIYMYIKGGRERLCEGWIEIETYEEHKGLKILLKEEEKKGKERAGDNYREKKEGERACLRDG